mgnify:CR=1 FL=1
MGKVAMTCRLPVRPGHKESLLTGLRAILEETYSEAGTELYLVLESAFDDTTVWVVEMYRDENAYITHRGSEVHKALEHELGELLDGDPELSFLRPVAMKPLHPDAEQADG